MTKSRRHEEFQSALCDSLANDLLIAWLNKTNKIMQNYYYCFLDHLLFQENCSSWPEVSFLEGPSSEPMMNFLLGSKRQAINYNSTYHNITSPLG